MDVPIPATDDHCRVKILVKQLGRTNVVSFNRILQRLAHINVVDVGDRPARYIRPQFVTQPSTELIEFGELQAHRKIFGFIGIVFVPTTTSESDALAALGAARVSYDDTRSQYHETLVNSRCVTFGMPDLTQKFFNPAELSAHNGLEDSDSFEAQIRDLLRTIYYVLESRRLDASFEKIESPTCPTVAQEERYRVGTENKSTKQYKKKCIGRLRKQCGDYAMLTGQYANALEVYQAAIDPLKSAAAYEGWAAAAIVARFSAQIEEVHEKAIIQRTVSMLPGQIADNNGKSQNLSGSKLGHMRHRSDDIQHSASTSAYSLDMNSSNMSSNGSSANSTPANSVSNFSTSSTRKPFKKALAMLNLEKSLDPRDIETKEILERIRLALENYERYSFIAYVEFECVIRAVNVYRLQRQYVDAEVFMRERVGKYLADTFTLFTNLTKSQICMICAAIYETMAFRRKNAFFLRLAVLFRLHVDDDGYRSEADYKLVYPVLYSTLGGYGIVDSIRTTKMGPVSVQVKALNEVLMSAQRAGFVEASVRHLCYILQTYFFYVDEVHALQFISELKRLISVPNIPKISLAQPLVLEQSNVILPPLQLTKFPVLSNFRIQPLSANLSPTVVPAKKEGDVFIYSPFQERDRVKNVLWVVDTGCQVSVRVENILSTELVVKNLTLHTDGCEFEPVPVRLTLAPCRGRQLGADGCPNEEQQVAGDVALLGVPRSPGLLTLTGYSCEVFDVENICSLKEVGEMKPITVQVIQSIPKLELRTTLKRAPVVEEPAGGIAEATVFSGQTFYHCVTMRNTSSTTGIKNVRVRINQPKVFGGPTLLDFLELEQYLQKTSKYASSASNSWTLDGLKPDEERELKFRVFGIDPSATAADDKNMTAAQNQVYVKRHNQKRFSEVSQATNCTSITSNNGDDFLDSGDKCSAERTGASSPSNPYHGNLNEKSEVEVEDEDNPTEGQRLLLRNESVASGEIPVTSTKMKPKNSTHDLIPYTGRLLTAEFVFTYVADISTENGEMYERTETLKLAITIVPALTVTDWQILAGDSPTTRFVVVDVTNLANCDAELTFGREQRLITVQPKELCRVPLLCPCATDIRAADFRLAAQRASHMMQMQEMELLRRRLEQHISQHLDIRWRISTLDLDGLVPVGPMLASVSFLKQLVVPSVSILANVNGKPYLSEDDVPARVGQLQELTVELISAIKDQNPFVGDLHLHCFQDLQNGSESVDRSEFLVICGISKRPFCIRPTLKAALSVEPQSVRSASDTNLIQKSHESVDHADGRSHLPHLERFKTKFTFLFRSEGVFKIRPLLDVPKDSQHRLEELILPTVSFNVKTRK